ncbi:hypothetical protein [Stagnimonas aquatica]|nr:hypothetical protein [Stagnimonas aquatica]
MKALMNLLRHAWLHFRYRRAAVIPIPTDLCVVRPRRRYEVLCNPNL